MAQSPFRRTALLTAAFFAAGLAAGAAFKRLELLGGAGPEELASSETGGGVSRERAARADPRSLARAEEIFQNGVRLLREERYAEALEAFRSAAALAPIDARPHHGMGEVYRRLHLMDQAEAAYRKALELEPDFHPSRKELAVLLHDRGAYREALEHLEKLERARPADPVVWGEMAINLLALGETRRAIDLLERYNAKVGPQAWGLTHLGRAYELAGDRKRAEALYREALRLDPAFGRALYWLGRLLAANRRFEESAQLLARYRKFQELEARAHSLSMRLLNDPDDAGALAALAQVRYLQGRRDDALRLVARARALRPGDPRLESLERAIREGRPGESRPDGGGPR